MDIIEFSTVGKKLTQTKEGKEIARIFIYFIRNDLHEKPYALLEDLYVQEEFRSQGYGASMVQAALKEAKKSGCYKVIATSRYAREYVHQLYLKLGFQDYGKEFRLNIN